MNAVRFLQDKGLLSENCTDFIIKFGDKTYSFPNNEINIVPLFDEYHKLKLSEQPKQEFTEIDTALIQLSQLEEAVSEWPDEAAKGRNAIIKCIQTITKGLKLFINKHSNKI